MPSTHNLRERAHAIRERIARDVATGRHGSSPDDHVVPAEERMPGALAAKTASELGLPFSDVVILFACNDYYVPFVSVALQSIKENASPSRRYDIVVLSQDLTLHSMCVLRDQMTTDNIGIGFLDVNSAIAGVKLPQHGHFRTETYYRLLAPELLNSVDKAIYLDSDLVCLRDVAELFDTNLDGCLLAATRDADTCGQADGYEPSIARYLTDVVGLEDPHDYFQAGVLVLNLAEFRRTHPSAELIELAASRHWQWLDQDVLNHVALGHYRRVPMCWNTLMDWQGLRRTHIIAQTTPEIRAEYEQARKLPAIIHYAGPDDRPWQSPNADQAEFFWAFAADCPYYEELRHRLRTYRMSREGIAKRSQVFMLYKVGMPLFDVVAPAGTRRRALGIDVYKRAGFNLI